MDVALAAEILAAAFMVAAVVQVVDHIVYATILRNVYVANFLKTTIARVQLLRLLMVLFQCNIL